MHRTFTKIPDHSVHLLLNMRIEKHIATNPRKNHYQVLSLLGNLLNNGLNNRSSAIQVLHAALHNAKIGIQLDEKSGYILDDTSLYTTL